LALPGSTQRRSDQMSQQHGCLLGDLVVVPILLHSHQHGRPASLGDQA
jgi:hypothetical protein